MVPAIVIMEMIEATAAGVGFTCDPKTGRQDILVINASFGLGEAVVSGAVDPDTYYLNSQVWTAIPRLTQKVLGQKAGITRILEGGGTRFTSTSDLANRQVLTDTEIEKLGLLLLRVFDALGHSEQHQDVEWAFNGQDFILVQARPVTILPRRTFSELKDQMDIWSNGNYRDAVPMVQSPLNRRLLKTIIDNIHESSCSLIGYPVPEGLQFSRFFNGRLYANLSALQWIAFDTFGILPHDHQIFWGGHQPEIDINETRPFRGLAGIRRLMYLLRAGSKVRKASKNATRIWLEVTQAVETLAGKELSNLKDREVIKAYENIGVIVRNYIRQFWFLSGAATTPVGTLLKVLEKHFGDKAPVMLNALLVGGTAKIASADHGHQLVKLAEIARQDPEAFQFFADKPFEPFLWEERLAEDSSFKNAFREFIREYGHRAVYELDIINPRWKEDSSYLLNIIHSTMITADLDQLKAGQKEKFEQAWQEIKEKVPFRRYQSIKKWIREAQEGAAVREQTKSVLALAINSYRIIAQEIGRRCCERGIIEDQSEIYFCTWPELFSVLTGEWDSSGLRRLIAERKIMMREMEMVPAPDIIFGESPTFTESNNSITGDCLEGVAVAAGKALGQARLIYHPDEGNRLKPGEVMIAPSTDPGWTPLFLRASALIMETGGFLSHGAIVAREYGVPAVVNIPGVMRVIKDGQKVIVDGYQGKVFLR